MNKRLLDMLAGCTAVLTAIAGMSYQKELIAVLPPSWTPWITYASGLATVILKVLAFYAPPTPSPVPPDPNATTKLTK